MSADFEWESKGFDELAAKLNAAAQEVKGPRARRMVRAGAEVFKKEMVERAPVLDKKTTGSNALEPGALKKDIKVRNVKNQVLPTVRVGPGGKTAYVANFVEYGHRDVHGGYLKLLGNGKSQGPGKAGDMDVPAHPFVRPTFEAAQGAAEAAMEADFDQPFEELK